MVACQPVPQPFSHTETGRTATLDLPDSGGIVVLEVAEVPALTSKALAQAMAAALAERNIPAGTGSGNRKSHFLQGGMVGDGHNGAIVWTLYDPRGEIVDTVRQSIEGLPLAEWVGAEPNLMRRLARQAAPGIAALIQGAAPNENLIPTLYVAEVTGAPGLGNRQLRNALRRHLGTAGLHLSGEPGTDSLTIVGSVSVGPASGGRQQATLEWRVLDNRNVEVGKIAQSNPVAAGSLNGSWGAIAGIAAQGAAEGINALVRRVDWNGATATDPGPASTASGATAPPR